MAIEIERRFLVKGKEWKRHVQTSQHLRQGYLVSEMKSWTIRIRIHEQEKAWLTLKSPIKGIEKHEFEYSIPLKDAELLWELTTHRLTKTRYQLNLPGGEWVVDCFEGNNAPLVIAEVELASTDAPIEKPNWCTQEISSSQQLSNAALAKTPLTDWPLNERLVIKLKQK